MNGYQLFLDENDLTDEAVRAISEKTDDHFLLPEYYGISVRPSTIEGKGLFADIGFSQNATMIAARVDNKRTIAGKFTNHSDSPNAMPSSINGVIYLTALRDIEADEEITINYRCSMLAVNQTHKDNVMVLENALLELDNIELEVNHIFSNGVYAREMHVPANVTLTGRVHRYPCINVISQGDLVASTDEGIYNISAPYSFVSGAGVKKAIHALTDSVWTTFHPWDGEEDLTKIEDHFTVSSYEEFERLT